MDNKKVKEISDRLDSILEWTKEVDKRDKIYLANLKKALKLAKQVEKNLDKKAVKIKRTDN